MTIDFGANNYVRQLRQAGPRPSDAVVRDIVRSGDAAFRPLLELATDLDLFDEDAPLTYAPLHALRLLGELPKPEMIEPLLREYPIEIEGEWDELPRAWASEAPQIIGRLGAEAVEPLWHVVDSAEWGEARPVAVVALNCAVIKDPSLRDAVVEGLRQRLRETDDTTLRTAVAIGLGNLGVAEEYGEIMGMFREGKIDKSILSAGVARQLLLSGGDRSLNCTLHTLKERYEQHGPSEQE